MRLLSLLLLPCLLSAQQYHTPAEVFKLLNDSKISYEIGLAGIPEVQEVVPQVQLAHGFFIKQTGEASGTVTTYDREFAAHPDYSRLFRAAESAFHNDSLATARQLYLSLLEIVPAHSQVMTYIGQSYIRERNLSAAAYWLRRAIAANYYDYMAHWFLADVHLFQENEDSAVVEIAIAKVLNRNNVNLHDGLVHIFDKTGEDFEDWGFQPQYELSFTQPNKVSIKLRENATEWMSYALTKALWEYEPGYADRMMSGVAKNRLVVEETECVINAVISQENAEKKSSDRFFRAAKEAVDDKTFQAFLLFDVVLVKKPSFVFLLPPQSIEQLASYIINDRLN